MNMINVDNRLYTTPKKKKFIHIKKGQHKFITKIKKKYKLKFDISNRLSLTTKNCSNGSKIK